MCYSTYNVSIAALAAIRAAAAALTKGWLENQSNQPTSSRSAAACTTLLLTLLLLLDLDLDKGSIIDPYMRCIKTKI